MISFDAWKNDFSNEPLLAFISTLDEQLQEYTPKTNGAKKSFIKKIEQSKKNIIPALKGFVTNRLVHYGMDAMLDEPTNAEETKENDDLTKDIDKSVEKASQEYLKNTIAKHQSIRKSIQNFSKSMSELLAILEEDKDTSLPLFIMIDELDRCRPNYAIEFLEIVKHLFDIPKITFIIATDSKQLSHAINAVYGQNFSSEKYLKRFFDQEYTLKTPDTYDYAHYLFHTHGLLESEKLFSGLDADLYKEKDLNVVLFSKYAEFFKLAPRDMNQCVIVLSAIVLTWNKKQPLYSAYLFFLIMLKQVSNEAFKVYIQSNMIDELYRNEIFHKSIKSNVSIIAYKYQKDDWGHINSKRSVDYNIDGIIESFSLLKSMRQSTLYDKTDTDISLIYNIFNNILHTENITAREDKKAEITLQKYPSLILQAGQFS